ncbi:MAG: hypothetical protein Q4G48_04880 [Bacteroidia bacterium]|nr:hypothetical protein [Bacteroidia bacterium]
MSRNQAEKIRKELLANSFFRLLVFIIGAVSAYFWAVKSVWFLAPLLAATAVFLMLLRRHARLSQARERAETTLKIAEDELKAFRYDFSPFDGMNERINPAHDFSFDLDVFGNGSISQIVNRTSLIMGRKCLADMLENPLTDKENIVARQRAVAELAQQEDFCLEFRVTGSLSGNAISDADEARRKFAKKATFKNKSVWKVLTVVVPAAYALYFGLLALGAVSSSKLLLVYLTTLGVSSIPFKKVKSLWMAFDKKSKTLSAYSRLFALMENTKFESRLLQELQRNMLGEKPASREIRKLAGYIRNLDSAFAFPVLLIVNPLFLWNVVYALKIENWLDKNSAKTHSWFSTLAEFDALVSLGTFAANHPHFSFPEISDAFCFSGEALGHPLIPHEKSVKNNVRISRKPYFMVVTGANMAGKSTYLRTVGVNHLLASIGAPVCAESLTFYPGRLLTNLRTSDSLVNNESYFFAELKRLKMIIESLQSGNNGLFIILDEILKGTNSEDKQKGSLSLMKRLVQLGGSGIIATHDLALGNLENEFPEAVKNFHFEADISGSTLAFTYKLEEGIAQNMNASFLMKSMGIVE